jgi:hypothetical protein
MFALPQTKNTINSSTKMCTCIYVHMAQTHICEHTDRWVEKEREDG